MVQQPHPSSQLQALGSLQLDRGRSPWGLGTPLPEWLTLPMRQLWVRLAARRRFVALRSLGLRLKAKVTRTALPRALRP